MNLKRLLVLLVLASLTTAQAEVWDFSKGRPKGLAAYKGTKFVPEGLAAVTPYDISVNAGCSLPKPFPFPEAFDLTFDIVPSALPADRKRHAFCLWDDMYVHYEKTGKNRGIQFGFERNGNRYTPFAHIGFGDQTLHLTGPSGNLEPGKPTRVVFRYDANGHIGWQFGQTKGESFIRRFGQLPTGSYPTKLGDRVGGNNMAFDGVLTRAEIRAFPRLQLDFLPDCGRRAFERGEEGARFRFEVCNFSGKPVSTIRLTAVCTNQQGQTVLTCSRDLADLRKDERRAVELPVETRLRPGRAFYSVRIEAEGIVPLEREFRLTVCKTFNPDRMPVTMWGFGPGSHKDVVDFGFTHGLDYGLGWRECPKANVDPMPTLRKLDAALAAGLRLQKSMGVEYPGGKSDDARYHRQKPDGSLARGISSRPKPVPEVSNPEFRAQARKTALRQCELFGDHPAFCGILPCSEARDDTCPSFNYERLAYERETGRKIPDEVKGCGRTASWSYVPRKKYRNGIVPEDDPVLAYYRWFWKGGDGWPAYTGAIADAYREGTKGRKTFWSFWDPATRCPPIWGSGGSVDYLNQWIYAVPEPMNVAAAGEEMVAMAAGRPGQQIQIMTQLICYRSQIAPTNFVAKPEPAWLKRRPLADFPTIPPDSLTEAVWSMLAKPVKGIMFHGWGTIFETGVARGYTYTSPEAAARLRDLLTNLVRPLGPSLRQIGREGGDFAVLESATTALLGGPATWGWMTPAITFVQRARLDPRVIYEETIERDGLAGIRVVYAPQCKYLTQKTVDALTDFQARGGILVGDRDMTKALKPDVVVPVISFTAPASDHPVDVDDLEARKTGDVKTREGTMRMKGKMQQDGEKLRAALAERDYRPRLDSSSPEIVTYYRSWKGTPYVFALNDKRTFGDYVGQWGKTMEKGLPFSGTVSLADPKGAVGAVYELSRGGRTPFGRRSGRVEIAVDYKTNDGRLFACLPEEIAKVKLATSDAVEPGGRLRVRFSVLGKSGKPVHAVLPVEVHVTDARGNELDGAGYATAVDGVCEYTLQTNLDDAEGDYTIRCLDRASGFQAAGRVARGRKLGWWTRLMRQIKGQSL